MMPLRPKICLNMIVRNEASIICRALQSVVEVVDCCVICDTGSTDSTKSVIRECCDALGIACEVPTFTFVNFSQARNAALDCARRSAMDFDYLLLMDADMELVLEDSDAFHSLNPQANAYSVKQQQGGLRYSNLRLLRRSCEASYVGSTHEVLVVPGDVTQLEGVYFSDHADGANRPEKLARDERLLRGDLKEDPHNTRSQFYLAQTLRDAGRFAEAAECYWSRFEAGGWAEERWYALYQQALCFYRMGQVASYVSGCLNAYALRPTRAEPLVSLGRYYAAAGQHDAALLMFEQALVIAWPSDDISFVEESAYGDAVRELIAISGFYSQLHTRQIAGQQACERLAVNASVALPIRQTARANLFFYARPLTELCPGASLHRLELDLPAPYVPTNPSFVKDGDGYRGVVRGVNYQITEGHYKIHDADETVRTRNFLVQLSAKFAIQDVREIADQCQLPRNDSSRIRGFEDCRLFKWQEQWWCSATSRDVDTAETATMLLLKMNNAGDFSEAFPMRGFLDAQHQKNWMPVVDDRLRFVYSCAPAVVLNASRANGELTVDSNSETQAAFEHWRGGGPLVPWDGGYLCVIHEAKDTAQGRQYVHRFVAVDTNLVAQTASVAFVFRAAEIEFSCGLTFDPRAESLILSFGAGDSSAWLASVPVPAVRSLLSRGANAISLVKP
jgi:glycosyltransferase involved in cell wall biosynthesis